MVSEFIAGFIATGEFLMLIAGGISAVLVFLMAVVMILFIAGAAFDSATEVLAKRWEKADREPKHWLGKIIMRRKRGDTDGSI